MSSTGKDYSLGKGLYELWKIFLEIEAEMQEKQKVSEEEKDEA